ncbi:uncharacterized protein METZ01_LOCUS328120, partial [marine metagenome]
MLEGAKLIIIFSYASMMISISSNNRVEDDASSTIAGPDNLEPILSFSRLKTGTCIWVFSPGNNTNREFFEDAI